MAIDISQLAEELFEGDLIEESKARRKQNHPYFTPSDEPLGWDDVKGKVVRLDVAITAFHLMAARIAFRNLPEVVREKIQDAIRAVEEKSELFLLGKIFGKTIGSVLTAITVIAEVMNARRLQQQVEKQIRTASIRAQRDVHTSYLSQTKHLKRNTRRVSSRHATSKQRRPNKSWRNP